MKSPQKLSQALLVLALCGVLPLFALTDGPKQPEYQSYIPVDVKDVVNLSTGDFSYSIDLLEVPTADGRGFPVNVHYMSGIGPDQEASWVGLGWNLNVGSISRSLVNYPDEYRDHKVNKRGNSTTRTQESTTLFTPYASVTYSHSDYGRGQWSYSLGGPNNEPEGGKESPAAEKKSFSFEGQFGISGNLGGAEAPEASGSRTFTNWTGSVWGAISGFGASHDWINTTTKKDFNLYQFGYLWKDDLLSENWPTLNTFNGSGAKLQDAYNMNSIQYAHDDDGHSPPANTAFDWPSLTSDIFSVAGYGINGQFRARSKNGPLLEEYVPANRLGLTGQGTWYNISNAFLTAEYYLNQRKTPNNYGFYFEDDPAGTVHTQTWWPYVGEYESAPNVLQKPQSKKVIPYFNSDGTRLIGFKVLNEQGITYEYMKPVYSYAEYSEMSNDPGAAHAGEYTTYFTPEGANEVIGAANGAALSAMEALTSPLYAVDFLLTAIKGPDYVDNAYMGVVGQLDDADNGYWIQFKYQDVSNSYIYRTPFHGKATASLYDQDGSFDGAKEQKYTFTYGRKDLIYLRNIITNQSVAVFDIKKREDGYESGDLAFGHIGSGTAARMESYYRLAGINLYNKRDMSSPGSDGIYEDADAPVDGPIKKVVFRHDYELAQGTPNSKAGGKLTLQKIQISGKGGTKLPPYQFDYAANPDYAANKWDRWGFYKSDGAAPSAGFLEFSNHQGIRQGEAKAWSMTSIELPSKGKLDIEYENDDYNTLQNLPIGTTIPNINAWENGVLGALPGKAFWQDDVFESSFPQGEGAYEIRTYAPGFVPPGNWTSNWDTPGSVYNMLNIHSAYIGSLTDNNSGEVVRRARIYRDEFPLNFNLDRIEVYAHGEGDPSLGDCDVNVFIQIEATKDDNTKVVLNPGIPSTNMNSPQWKTAVTTLPILPLYKYIDIEFRAKESGTCFGSSSINQRDFRVFLREPNANKTALNLRKKLGGGIRVKKIDIVDPVFQKTITKTYSYDDGNGGSSGSATQEPAPFNSENNDDRVLPQHAANNLISTEKVFYGKVKVQTSGTGIVEYDFHTPRDKYVDLKDLDDDVTYPGLIEDTPARNTLVQEWTRYYNETYGLPFKAVRATAIDNQHWWGLPKATTTKDGSGAIVMKTENKYSISRDYSNLYESTLNDRVRTDDFHDNNTRHYEYIKMNSLTVVSYIPKLTEKITTKDNFTVTEKFAYSKNNGQVNSSSKEYRHTAAANPKQVRTVRKTFAFENKAQGLPYSSMGHQDGAPIYSYACATCKNMLTQVAEEYVTWDNGDGATGEKYLKADIFPWKSYSPGQIYKEGRFQWRAENEGSSAKPVFPWSNLPWSSNDAAWVKNHRVLKYDGFEHPVEVEDATGVVHASVFGYGNHLQTGYLPGLGFAEASVFTGDYDTGEDPEYFDRFNGWSKGKLPGGISEVSGNGHFGKKSVHVVNAYGPVKDVVLAGSPRKAYTLSAWFQSVSGSCLLYVDQRKPGASFPEVIPGSTPVNMQINAGDRIWRKYQVEMPAGSFHPETEILRAHVGCPSGGEAYIDEIRFAPTTANLRTVYYDPELRVPLSILDANGVPEFYEYDGLGRLTGVRDSEGALKEERAFVQKFDKPDFSFSPIQIIWDGTAGFCTDEFAKHLALDEHVYEIQSSSNPSQISVDGTKTKICPVAIDNDGNGSSQIVIKSLLTNETVTVPATVHGPHFVTINVTQKAECDVRPEPGVQSNCLLNWAPLHAAANLDVAAIVSYKMELDMKGVIFETYSWMDEAFPFAQNNDYQPRHGAHIYFGWQDGYQGTSECLRDLTNPACLTTIARPAFVRASGFLNSDNIGLLLPNNPVWGSGTDPNYQGPWNFTQQFEWPSKYFLNPPHFHNTRSFPKSPYSLYVGLYGWASNAAWRPITLAFGTSVKLVGATVINKF